MKRVLIVAAMAALAGCTYGPPWRPTPVAAKSLEEAMALCGQESNATAQNGDRNVRNRKMDECMFRQGFYKIGLDSTGRRRLPASKFALEDEWNASSLRRDELAAELKRGAPAERTDDIKGEIRELNCEATHDPELRGLGREDMGWGRMKWEIPSGINRLRPF